MTIATTSAIYAVQLRDDLDRDDARDYWAGPHAAIVCRLPHLVEYRQHHFSLTEHGYWPASPRVATEVPGGWRLDGIAEVRFAGLLRALSLLPHLRHVRVDEQNVFRSVLGCRAAPRGGRWWTECHDPTIGHRTTVLVRRRAGVSQQRLTHFLHDALAPALAMAGARDLRVYDLRSLLHPTPGVSHHNPPHRRYHGAFTFGVDDRNALDALLRHPGVASVVAEQDHTCVALHAYAVERTVPVVAEAV